MVWWLLTPPPRMGNAGDHAQAVALARWLPLQLGAQPLEVDKDEYAVLAPILSRLIRADELVLIHSGGNLGDRGRWTEPLRRRVIRDLPANRVVSLPQTIYFSPTEQGRAEAAMSADIYAAHPHLEVVARDPVSLEIGEELFPVACHMAAPDPVLTLERRPRGGKRDGVLLCIRSDNESALTPAEKATMDAAVAGQQVERIDTGQAHGWSRDVRAEELDRLIDRFARHRLVVTDRFHGAVFAYLANTPCLILEAAGHKIRGGMHWFSGDDAMRLLTGSDEADRWVSTWLHDPPAQGSAATEQAMSDAFLALGRLLRERSSEH